MDSATAVKRDGMARAERNANPEWWRFMLAIGLEVCRRKPLFTTDDMESLRLSRDGPITHENRAMGPLMRQMQQSGWCEPTEDWAESRQRVNHRRPQRVWYSLVYQGPQSVRRRRRRPHDPRQIAMLEIA